MHHSPFLMEPRPVSAMKRQELHENAVWGRLRSNFTVRGVQVRVRDAGELPSRVRWLVYLKW